MTTPSTLKPTHPTQPAHPAQAKATTPRTQATPPAQPAPTDLADQTARATQDTAAINAARPAHPAQAPLSVQTAPLVHPTSQPPASTRGAFLLTRLLLFALLTAAACLASQANPHLLQSPLTLPLLLGAIAIAMWHGAYDRVQAEQILAPTLGRRWPAAFLGGYLFLAALTVLGWLWLPLASLLFFLAYSSWHFGSEPEQSTPSLPGAATAFALGAIPVVAACRWHAPAVQAILTQMLGGTTLHGTAHPAAQAATLTRALATLCWPLFALAFAGTTAGWLGRARSVRLQLLVVLFLLAALFRWCDPLLAFAVYFCCWHTPEHLIATSLPAQPGASVLPSLTHNLRAGLLPWLLSVAGLCLVFAFGRQSATAYEAEIFIVLSALTVPHMALNELRRALPKPASHPAALGA